MKTIEHNNIDITIKGIILYEKMTGKAFSSLSMDNVEDIIPLLYCILISHPENNIVLTYQEIRPLLVQQKILEALVPPIVKKLAMLKQFERIDPVVSNGIDSSFVQTDQTQVFMKDIVPVLVSDCGLDINYVLNEMSYLDVQDYLKYREQKHQNELEEKRLFTFLVMSPNLDMKKKRVTPETILPFPWEEKKKKEKAMSDLDKVQEKLKSLGIIQDKEKTE